jgi:hypothetical protein
VKAQARLDAGLIAGDPDGEVTIAWVTAQHVMDLYQHRDPDQARTAGTARSASWPGWAAPCTPGATSWPRTSPTPT